MTNPERGRRTLSPQQSEDIFYKYGSPRRRQAAAEGIPYHLDVEVHNRCPGSCLYCENSSEPQGALALPRERLLQLIDEALALGTRQILWNGGEPLWYPHLFELIEYTADRGIASSLFTSALPMVPALARRLAHTPNLHQVAINFDTIDPQVYRQLHADPQGLEKKVQGYKNLLEAGYPPDRIFPSLCLTQPAIASVEATIDWLVDEMGARFVFLPIFIPSGFGRGQAQWEPSLSEVRRACEYRARKLGSHWLRIGSLDCNVTHCRIKCYINYAGEVLPCNYLTHLSAGNIYRESLVEIHRRGKQQLHFQGLQIRGRCGRCDNHDVCFGCRAKAYLYLGDEAASDPKCWMNPEAPEHVWQTGSTQ